MLCLRRTAIVLAILTLFAGCWQRVKTPKGGTPGNLHTEALPVSGVGITVFRLTDGEYRVVGFAETKAEGDFELLQSDGTGPLFLEPAGYRFTLIAVATRFPITKEFTSPETTPLKVEWTADDSVLDFDLPAPPTPF